MPGLYIHIPFCKKKCIYCDFYSVASISHKEDFLQSLLEEMRLQKNYLGNQKIETIYFGGGTPSLLTADEIKLVIDCIYKTFSVNEKPEITMEANPDDLSPEYISSLAKTGINRLSIGVQSFNDSDLQLFRRRHNSMQALQCVKLAQDAGFRNISIDLIYGLPGMTAANWSHNLAMAYELNVPHLSAYHLTYEPNTSLANSVKKEKIKPVEEDQSIELFKILIAECRKHDFIHYEISNFCKEGYFSIHNSNYWKQEKYLGVGPSAHSYNLDSRQWNVSNVQKYIEAITARSIPAEIEMLDQKTRYNDYILTSLRTMWGADLAFIQNKFSAAMYRHCTSASQKFIDRRLLTKIGNFLVLTDEGKFISDTIIGDLFTT